MVRLGRTIILYVVLLATARCVDADGPVRPDHDGESWTCVKLKRIGIISMESSAAADPRVAPEDDEVTEPVCQSIRRLVSD
jgi:hypothetical protein